MLGCHIAREVKVRLQKGLRFRFRESQVLEIMLPGCFMQVDPRLLCLLHLNSAEVTVGK